MSGSSNSNKEKPTVKKTDNWRNKPIGSVTGNENPEHQVRFEPRRFNELVFDKGYEVFIDKALRCPCVGKGTGQALLTCDNCLGVGWFFVNRIETRIAVQQLKADVKYENWSQTTAGMAKITARAIDKLAFMDRIILREVEGFFTEVTKARVFKGSKVCFLIYEPLEIEEIYMFISDNQPLRVLKPEEYLIDGHKLMLDSKFDDVEKISISVRYRHCLTYHIIDMTRDIMKVRTKENCAKSKEELSNMPIGGMARKAHYILDNQKYDEAQRLIENSYKE